MCTVRVHCAHPVCQKIAYRNVYEIPIHACTPNYSSVAWKTKKLGKQCAMCTVLCACALCAPYLSKNSVYECLRNANSHLHTKLQLFTLKNKKVGKQCKMCAVQCACALCTPYLSKNSVWECLRNLNSHLHTKLQLSSLKNKKVGKTVRNVHSAVGVCTICTLFVKK